MTAIDTTRASYEAIKPKAKPLREVVLAEVERFNDRGGTSRTQIAKALELNEITVGSRLTELLQAGKIKRGNKTTSASGKPEYLYLIGSGQPVAKVAKEPTIDKQRLIEILRVFGVDAQDVLSTSGFLWNEQPEGQGFWSHIYKSIDKNNG